MTIAEKLHYESGCPCSSGMSTVGVGLEYCSDCGSMIEVDCWKIIEIETKKEVARASTKKEILAKYKELNCSRGLHTIVSK